MKKYINHNYFWASLFVEQLAQMGVRHVCLSPGSRNTSLTFAFASNRKIKKYIHIDERSSGFFALGIAKETNRPVAIVTTSGTAVAELYPAIIEAYQQRIPLIICTADRPSYLRDVGANQTINQDNIYKNHIRYFADFGQPSISENKLKSLSRNARQGVCVATHTDKGPVHFNLPFKKPFEPSAFTDEIKYKLSDFILPTNCSQRIKTVSKSILNKLSKTIESSNKGIILLGWDNYDSKFNDNLIQFSKKQSLPIFADGTNSLRFLADKNQNIISNYTAHINHFKKDVDFVIQFGNAPTSQSVLSFLSKTKAQKIPINKFGDVKDPSVNKGKVIAIDENEFVKYFSSKLEYNHVRDAWLEEVKNIDDKCETIKRQIISKRKFGIEPSLVNKILNSIPNGSNLFISNSTPIRDFDFFASNNEKNIKIFTNRGASGIDGIISTASGIASQSKKDTFLVIGDLAFYHNLTALSTLKEFNIPLKIILVNNNGGGIFNMLPVSQNNRYFEKYWRTPLNISYSKIVKGFGGLYFSPKSWKNLSSAMDSSIGKKVFSVIEVKTDSKKSLELRKKYWDTIKRELS